jgi:hypothetical protein
MEHKDYISVKNYIFQFFMNIMNYKIILMVILLFLICPNLFSQSFHFEFKHEIIPRNELYVYIFSSIYNSECSVRINNPNFGNQLIDIEYISGRIEIGDYLFTLEKENIIISLTLEHNVYFNMFPVPTFSSPNNNFVFRSDGSISYLNVIVSEEEKMEILKNTTDIIFKDKMDYQIIREIYEQENRNMKLFFEYRLITNDEIINVQLNENMIIEFVKQY